IRTISENGQPFFTKDAIRDVYCQLNRSTEKGHKITIRGLDDMLVEFTLVMGDISSRIIRGDGDDDDEKEGQEKEYGEDADTKHDMMNPCIRYKSLQMLLDYPQPLIDLHGAYCIMHIAHHSVLKNIVTGKILDGSDAPLPSKKEAKNFLELDDRPIVLSCAPSSPIKQIALDLCRPLMLISDNVRPENDQGLKMSNLDMPRIRDLIRDHYDIIDFAQDPDNLGYEDNFGHVSIYVRRLD
ncbi:hypothetical protein DPV78_011651, partial [Talaromyces pinophilus]